MVFADFGKEFTVIAHAEWGADSISRKRYDLVSKMFVSWISHIEVASAFKIEALSVFTPIL